MKALYLDCFSGISGDMTVGALCDLGVKPSALEWELSKLDIGDFHMHFERAQRQKIEGVHFSIHEGATHTHDQDEHGHGEGHEHHHHDVLDHCHGHEHVHAHVHQEEHKQKEGLVPQHEQVHASAARLPHANDQDHGSEVLGAKERHLEEHANPSPLHEHEHGHKHEHSHGHAHHDHDEHDHECCGDHHHHEAHGRTHAEIRELIETSDLSPFVKKHALSIFHRIAEAEAKIHGMSVEDVHFHEVGALDSIADIICTCVGLETLGVDEVYVSPMHEGRGWITCAHGRFPLPAPATLEIFKGAGISIGETEETHELITPTGAAIVAEFAISAGPMPRMKVEKIGYGIGTRDLASRPNVLRAVIGELE